MATLRTYVREAYRRAIDVRARYCADVPLQPSAVAFAPHQDDEVLGCGGTLIKKLCAGAEVRVAYLTDGSASHRGLIAPEELRVMRAREAVTASAILGLDPRDALLLDLPDGELGRHRGEAIRKVIEVLAHLRPEQVFVPYRKDTHGDHVAANDIVRSAVACFGGAIAIYEYPVWFWYHWPMVTPAPELNPVVHSAASPRAIRRTLASAFRSFTEFRACTYVGDVLDRKRDALLAYHSQTTRLHGDARWHTLWDVAGGEFVEACFQQHELFRLTST